MKKFFFFLAALILAYAGVLSYLYFDLLGRNKNTSLLFEESEALKKKLQMEVADLTARQYSLQRQNEALKKESFEYLKRQRQISQTQGLQEKTLKQQIYALKESDKRLDETRKKIEELKERNLTLSDIHSLALDIKVKKQAENIIRLESDLSAIKGQLKKQEALLHYNLGVCYTKEKSFEMAIDEYEKVLAINPKDADTHYNLAILYDDFRKNPRRALEHYRNFLEARPEAPEADEVKEWIEKIEKTLGI